MAYFRCTGEGGAPAPAVQEPYLFNLQDVYFNSGVKHTANTKVVFKASFNIASGYGCCFGTGANSFNLGTMCFYPNAEGYRCAFARTGQVAFGSFLDQSPDTTQMFYNLPIIVTCENKTASWYEERDPSDVHSITASSGTVDGGVAPMGIFCCNNSPSTDGWNAIDPVYYMHFFWMEVYESNVLTHRFVPAYNNSQYCLYDEVAQTYIYEVNGNYSRLRGSSDIPTS